MKRLHTGCAHAVALVVLLSGADVSAQNLQDVGRAAQQNQRILQQQEQIERERREREENARRTPSGTDLTPQTTAPTNAAANSACSNVTAITLQGATLLEAEQREQLTANYLGKCLTLADINQLIADITNAYVKRGYVTARVYIPAQDIGSGTLQLLVVEGRVQSLLLQPAESASATTAFPNVVGNPLNLRDLEQGLDQINRLHSNSATIDIQPGDGPGASQVVINNTVNKRWQANIGVDNSGTRATGLNQYSASLGFDNALSANDYLNLSARRSGESNEYSENEALYFAVPYGYWLFSANASQFNYGSLVKGQVTTFETTGSSLSQNINAERVIYRDQATKWTIDGGITLKQIRNYIEGETIDASSPNLSIATIETNITQLQYGTLFSFNLGIDKGLSGLGAHDDPSGLPSNAPQAQYLSWKYGVSASRDFTLNDRRFNWQSDLRGQYSRDELYGTEQMAIGSLFTVRGFREITEASNRGAYLRNTLGMPIDVDIGATATQIQPYLGYDIGHVAAQDTLSGFTLGCNALLGAISAQLAYSHPGAGPSNSDEHGWLYGSLTVTF